MKIEKLKRRNLFIPKSSAEYRMDKQFQNFLILEISIVFQIEKILKIC